MPIIPTYRRQERYSAPNVQMSSSAPNRINEAYENDLQEGSAFLQSVMKYLEPKKEKESQAPSGAARASAGKQKLGVPVSQKEKYPTAADEDLQIRMELADSVRQTVTDGKTVTPDSLDEFAVSHLTENQADTPAARDYMMLRSAARADAQTAARQERQNRISQEAALVRGVGATASSVSALEAYLSAQIPAFQERLKENGASQKNIQQQSAALRAQTAVENVCRSLAAGNPSTAQAVFEKYAADMNVRQRETCTEKIRLRAAASYAQTLWERAAGQETDGSLQQRQEWAVRQLSGEKNTALKTEVQENLARLYEAAQTQEHLRQAQVYRSLAEASAGEARGLMDTQSVLDVSEMRLACRAAAETDGGALKIGQAAQFNRLYFSGSSKEIAKAYEKKQVSARDYCLLQAVCHERAAGKDDRESRFLCRGIDQWSAKKGFSEQESNDIKYAVLTAAGGTENQLDAWRRIKALFDN